ncbi:MAG: hypothetical protein IPI73_23625 [Betaproteobacteria bacterium]|nr:hypothetical protein [Betaproteobacteria bacterium]
MFKSTDAGANWTKASNGLFSGTVYAIAIDPAHPSTLYVGSSFGIWRSTDGAANWINMTNGIGSKTVVSLAIDPTSTSTVYAMTRNSGVYKSTNGGPTGIRSMPGLPRAARRSSPQGHRSGDRSCVVVASVRRRLSAAPTAAPRGRR